MLKNSEIFGQAPTAIGCFLLGITRTSLKNSKVFLKFVGSVEQRSTLIEFRHKPRQSTYN